jgi:hypothetical protein
MKFITRSVFYKQRIEPAISNIPLIEYLLLRYKSPLQKWGWFQSRRKNSPVDEYGSPLPWFTYSFLDAFSDRIPSDIRVFEYGSGMSTGWWAARVREVVSVEHHLQWYERIRSELPENATVVYRNLEDQAYTRAILEQEGDFDLIIIDGRERVACTYTALQKITPSGVIIFDNSERDKYKPAMELLTEAGFRRLRFTGFIPQDFMGSETSIFYRDGNCFGI